MDASVSLLPEGESLHRSLSASQIQMLAFGGIIGTGLFLGIGSSLAESGPASLLISFSVLGVSVYCTMLALGEMSVYMPVAGSFCTYVGRYVDEALSFSLTWNYWLNDTIALASHVLATRLVVDFWLIPTEGDPVSASLSLPPWKEAVRIITPITSLSANIILNMLPVGGFGEIEYWLSSIKVFTVAAFIVNGILCNLGVNNEKKFIGFRYWKDPGAFNNGIIGVISSFVNAAFAYAGTESIALTAGEAKSPITTLPKAIRFTAHRVLLLYIISVLVVGINLPYNTPGLDGDSVRMSPFTFVFKKFGVPGAASIMNLVILSSALSAGNHSLYAGTRLLYSLAKSGHAPKVFSKCNKHGIPWLSVLATSATAILCLMSSQAGKTWGFLLNVIAVSNQISWIFIAVSSLRFRKALRVQGKTHRLYFPNWTYPVGPYIIILLNGVFLFLQGYKSLYPFRLSLFVSYYMEIPIVLGLYLIWKIYKKTKLVSSSEADLETDWKSLEDTDSA
ncbi:amino acid transmembrane transporter [Schizosaccharomyces pombe]|uniref:Probable amino-acid permease PB1C11.02 n=1 Tax=Schizosaccharomyces pombe (strain 972 / ATCC 24843) TaxID=284812 RepID=YQD2_SCHPO|nr:amino-acid permease [Schizosaccharomyces pombe]Q9C0V0.1 RecName: Full=Probable amino-acid permease PB1C11.02 [Schizosaccharomyces pombe 972h-]CAC36935.1 amino acid permease (predicted) [Schizosaccharomyces pombe]|eukprot:NP_588425.1 amino-acid permease [Schizosaccharomyces pombe]